MAQQQGGCCAQLRPRAEPTLQQQGLQLADVLPMLEAVDSQDELQEALKDADSQSNLKGSGKIPLAVF